MRNFLYFQQENENLNFIPGLLVLGTNEVGKFWKYNFKKAF